MPATNHAAETRVAKPLISVFMPARNEEATIDRNLGVLKRALQQGKIRHAVIVVDGSVDRTPALVGHTLGIGLREWARILHGNRPRTVKKLSNGFIFIRHAAPQGKGTSFVEAVDALHKLTRHFDNPSSVLVNVDADALDLEEKKITDIAESLWASRKPMMIGTHLEKRTPIVPGDDSTDQTLPTKANPDDAGFRAITSQALKPLLRRDPLWVRTIPRWLYIEAALNCLVYEVSGQRVVGNYPQSSVELLHSPPYRHIGVSQQQKEKRLTFERFHAPGWLEKQLANSAASSDYSWAEDLALREHVLKNLVKKK